MNGNDGQQPEPEADEVTGTQQEPGEDLAAQVTMTAEITVTHADGSTE
jgi:hypothetical protein